MYIYIYIHTSVSVCVCVSSTFDLWKRRIQHPTQGTTMPSHLESGLIISKQPWTNVVGYNFGIVALEFKTTIPPKFSQTWLYPKQRLRCTTCQEAGENQTANTWQHQHGNQRRLHWGIRELQIQIDTASWWQWPPFFWLLLQIVMLGDPNSFERPPWKFLSAMSCPPFAPRHRQVKTLWMNDNEVYIYNEE